MEINKKQEKELLEKFEMLKYDLEEGRDRIQDLQNSINEKHAKYMTLRKVFEILGIKYKIMDGDDQNAFI